MYADKTYETEENTEILCKVTDLDSTQKFMAVGIRHETVCVRIEHDSEGREPRVGYWYTIEGTVREFDDWRLTLVVDEQDSITYEGEKVNDWLKVSPYDRMDVPNDSSINSVGSQPDTSSGRSHSSGGPRRFKKCYSAADLGSTAPPVTENMGEPADLEGFSTGGGKDVNNFRSNVRNGVQPHPDSLTTEGLLYEYEFNVGSRTKDSLFYPSYEQAVSVNPVTGETEHHLAVGLDSGMNSFERPPLDLMVVVDVSGSMNGDMSEYYYDDESSLPSEKKIETTKRVLKRVADQLDDTDRLGVVLYDTEGWIAKPLRYIEDTAVEDIKDEIGNIRPLRGTNLQSGFETAVREFKEFAEVDTNSMERESRVLFLTDAMPNTGTTSETELVNEFESAASDGIHTTFVGIGIDANPDLIESISSVRGANHYFVDSKSEFVEEIADNLPYIVSPLVFNITLTVEGENFEIADVFGSPNDNAVSTGDVLNVETLFPSTGDDGAKGGVILVGLDEINPTTDLRLSVSWTERDGSEGGDVTSIEMKNRQDEFFQSDNIRKAVLLKRYAETLDNWMQTDSPQLDGWERQSTSLKLSDELRDELETIAEYMREEIETIGNEELKQELEVIETLLDE